MPELHGGSQPIPLGGQFTIRAPGLRGRAERQPGRDLRAPVVARSGAEENPAFDAALLAHGMEDVATIELSGLQEIPGAPAGADVRSPSGEDALELEAPDPGEGFDAVVLAIDESGAVTWNYPLSDTNEIEAPVMRGSGQRLRFRIPRTPHPAPPPGAPVHRGLLSGIGRKLLKVLVYPITDVLVGAAVDFFANRWEQRKRPYRLRTMTPENYANPDVPAIARDDQNAWNRLGGGRSLLFIHGTFSTIHGGFAGLTADDVQSLSQAYGGRLFGFDHFTLSHSPTKNVEELAARLPDGAKLDLDIVCHSRGGLVARELVECQKRFGFADGRIQVRNVVFVGVPNGGTPLTNPDHMVHMIDRFTSALNVFPDNFVTDALEAIITVVKVIGHGGLKSLDGLAAMNPKGRYLQELVRDSAGKANYLAMTTDFEPRGTPMGGLALKDGVMDRVFEDAQNDLVVPTLGVYDANGSPCFPLVEDHRFVIPSAPDLTHTTYFRNAQVRERLKQWLTGNLVPV